MTSITLHVLSDVHLEFAAWPRRVPMAGIDCDVHILAGDIGVGLMGLDWALKTFTRPVIYVMGNHELYGQRTTRTLWAKARAKVAGTHVHLLENEAVIIAGVRFVGASLWTDFCLHGFTQQKAMMHHAADSMNDYARIRMGRSGATWQYLTPQTTLAWHEKSCLFLESALDNQAPHDVAASSFRRTVVVTHHAPSAQSLGKAPPFPADDAAYASSLEDLVVRADLWVHGHTHVRADYLVDNGQGGHTRVVSNPRGYVGVEPVKAFDPQWVVTLPL